MVPFILGTIAALERATGQDFSEQLIYINPSDRESAVGINVLDATGGAVAQKVEEFTSILRSLLAPGPFRRSSRKSYVLASLGWRRQDRRVPVTVAEATYCKRKAEESQKREHQISFETWPDAGPDSRRGD